MNNIQLLMAVENSVESVFRARLLKKALDPKASWMTERQEPAAPHYQVIEGVALIPVRGYLVKSAIFYDETEMGHIRNVIREAGADLKAKAILMLIDSPGGEANGVAEIEDAIKLARKSKPVFAQVDGQAASGAYWIASQADAIYANRLDMVGSIGVRMVLYDESKAYADMGVTPIVIDTGEYKSIGVSGTEITDAQKEYLENIVQTYFQAFTKAIQDGRKIKAAQVASVADGRVFMGQDALDKKLIDAIQSLDITFSQIVKNVSGKKSQPRLAAQRLKMELLSRGL